MNLIQTLLYTGIFFFAITGALKARTHQMDVFGATVLAFVTAYGGGTIRDLLINVPVNWVNDYFAMGLVVAAVLIISLFRINMVRFRKLIFFTDAIGLGLFTAGGIERSLMFGINEGYAVIMGVMSATFGGLVADIICGEVPNLLKRGELYATACLIGGIIYLLLKKAGIEYNTGLFICVVIIVAIRIVSKLKRLTLPEI
ncbi:trimeric intracellular cation channel family protein [Sediminibacterium ginsengisoli]|uniref:Uncharacterized membrane protein YeiH n=1 Tax=Sediminibacterium ginsengisoli TaxID=413434 RepID=A0A1T4N8D3_9BACT|nr:trimeric intracellular cation channel family protein [Sediminibacterium ginsengisoli]SJZ75395.1 Uncharacterized membrane protein YeiH [Sediminibacterium ginsengisoli]